MSCGCSANDRGELMDSPIYKEYQIYQAMSSLHQMLDKFQEM